MSTFEDLAVQALARCAEYSNEFPTPRSVLYRRLGLRQQQLFNAAALINREYYGASAVGTLDSNGAISLATLGDPTALVPVEMMALISRVEVAASSGAPGVPAAGTQVAVVPVTDQGAEMPPRVTLRGGTFAPVGTDLIGVSQILVYYARLPFYARPTDGATVVELAAPYEELLVLDAARWMLRKMASLTQAIRTVALDALAAEEQELLAAYAAAVGAFTSAVERGRFARTQTNTRQ